MKMDKTLKELIERENLARNQLEWADNPDTIQNAMEVLDKARQLAEAYRIFCKKEYEYNLAVEKKDKHLKTMQDLNLVLKQI
jgi:hypothetical protein